MLRLSDNQQEAFNYIVSNLSSERVILLEGSAGTGKSTLTKSICNYYNMEKNVSVCAIAPTHKSKKIIKNILNTDTIIPISALTVASALGKIKEHSYVGSKVYSSGNNKKLSSFGLFIIDEVSMIRDEDLQLIISFVMKNNKQLLIIGDSNQIPCPTAKFIVTNVIEKADSYIFKCEEITKICLSEIVRQSADSPIIRIATYVKNHLYEDIHFTKMIDDTNFTNLISYSEIYNVFIEHYMQGSVNSCRIIAYTNSSVKTHNMEVRNAMGYEDEFVIGELLTGYSNVGWPELRIENGEDYYINTIRPTTNHSISKFNGLVGKIIQLEICDTKTLVPHLFFININHPQNNLFMHHLISLGEKLNSHYSTKDDYRKYMELKECVIFLEDIYRYEDKIYTEMSFKESHPLLFTNVNEVITNDYVVKENLITTKINTAYSDIITQRTNDKYKPLGDSEKLADRYKVIEKDIYYGYSITAHKSQGSTYYSVIADEPDFDKICNRWNFRYNKLEHRIKEKNQLRYVAYTRAKHLLYIVNKTPETSTNMNENDVYDERYEHRHDDI